MNISSLYLEAFVAAARTLNMTKAANEVHLSQSALSQRILNLEHDLGVTLFYRSRIGLKMTERGHELLRFCMQRDKLEKQFLFSMKSRSDEIVGDIRIGTYSSISRSVILPILTKVFHAHSKVRMSLSSKETHDLFHALKQNEFEYIVSDNIIKQEGFQSYILGYETYVLAEKRNYKGPDIYLDHNQDDNFTLEYLKGRRARVGRVDRMFLGDIYGLIDGVRSGLGRALLPLHLIQNDSEIVIHNKKDSKKVPVVLYFHDQSFYSKLHDILIKSLKIEAPKTLGL